MADFTFQSICHIFMDNFFYSYKCVLKLTANSTPKIHLRSLYNCIEICFQRNGLFHFVLYYVLQNPQRLNEGVCVSQGLTNSFMVTIQTLILSYENL